MCDKVCCVYCRRPNITTTSFIKAFRWGGDYSAWYAVLAGLTPKTFHVHITIKFIVASVIHHCNGYDRYDEI